MSSFGLAQFGLAATNAFNKEKERLGDKKYDRDRQAKIDQRAEQTERRTQENHQVQYEGNLLKADASKALYKTTKDAQSYTTAVNQVKALTAANDHMGALDVITSATNNNSRATWKIGVERNDKGSPVVSYNEAGEAVYNQNVYDKETGAVLSTTPMTIADMQDSLGQLNNGQAMDAANAAAQQKRQEALQKNEDELSLHAGKTNIDAQEYATNKGVDVKAHAINKGVDNGYEMGKIEQQHQNSIGLSNNNANNTQVLAGINHGYRSDEIDQRSRNSINEDYASAGIDQGQAPNISGDRGTQIRMITDSLIGTESGGKSTAFRTNDNGLSYGGLLQMGDGRLQDYANATGTRPVSASQFKNLSASQQNAVNQWHINDLINAAEATGAIGSVINGKPVTLSGLVAVAHLGGKGGMNKFVKTRGKYNPSDQLGTSLTDYLEKHRGASGGINVSLPKTLQPKSTRKSSSANNSNENVRTAKDFNVNVDKGVDNALKSVKQLGAEAGPASTAYFSQAGTKLKEMTKAKDNGDFISLYQEAFDLVIQAVPERDRKKLSKADKNALGHKVLLSMAGVSSLSELKKVMYDLNPSLRAGDGGGKSPTMLPGQQPRRTRPTPKGNNQVGKLQALSLRGVAPKINPAAQETMRELNDLNNSTDW